MKNKKGQMIPSLIGWGVGIVVLIVGIVFITDLLQAGKEAGASIGTGIVPGEKPPTTSSVGSAIPEDVSNYFDSLVKLINNNKDGERCLIPLEKPKLYDNYVIALAPGSLSIRLEGGGLTDKFESIDGFEPCIVVEDGAENFFNNWFGNNMGNTPNTPEYYENDEANSLIILKSRTKLITPNKDNEEYEISDEAGWLYLYKAQDKNHFCFISIQKGSGCRLIDDNRIKEGCFKDVLSYSGLMLCGASTDSTRERILHVKIDPGDNPTQRWAFHLTNDQNLRIGDVDVNQRMFKDEVSGKKVCNVFSVNEETGLWPFNPKDHLATWYIAPGGRIMTLPDANRIFDGIDGKILDVTQASNKRKGSPYPEDNGETETVGGATYSYYVKNDECGNDYDKCALFARGGQKSNYIFIPKHELLCDDEGYWNVCGLFVDGITKTVDGVTYTCEKSSAATWVWR